MKTIPLTQDKFALIDDEDFDKVSKFIWYTHLSISSKQKKYYAARRPHLLGLQRENMLHRFILDLKPGDTCRFIDGNSLNCQKQNLQFTKRSH